MGISANNTHLVAIAPTTAIATSEPFDLRASGSMQNPINYSVISSPLGAAEEVAVEVWNEADQAFQSLNKDGAPLKLTQDNDWLTFDSVSLRVRFVKTASALPVGVALVQPRAVI
ncbi:MAG TPA: hypothetical protein PLQ39_08735 [Acinetobacter sp.]|nr:hypothetical protein [Acinetobacter sp.]